MAVMTSNFDEITKFLLFLVFTVFTSIMYFFLQFPFKPPSKPEALVPPALRAGFLRGVINSFLETFRNHSYHAVLLNISVEADGSVSAVKVERDIRKVCPSFLLESVSCRKQWLWYHDYFFGVWLNWRLIVKIRLNPPLSNNLRNANPLIVLTSKREVGVN